MKGMDYSMDLQLRRLLWYFEDDIAGEKFILVIKTKKNKVRDL